MHRQGLARILALPRVLLALVVSALLGFIISAGFPTTSAAEVMARELPVGLATLMAFGLFEKWPARLPPWLARWFVQVAAVAVCLLKETKLLLQHRCLLQSVQMWPAKF